MTETVHRHPLLRLWDYATNHRRSIVMATLFSVLNKIFDLAPPALIGAAVDIVVSRENSLLGRMGIKNIETQLWVLAAITIVIWVLESVFEYMYAVRWRNLAQTMQQASLYIIAPLL